MLATKGAMNERRTYPVTGVRVVGEDTDVTDYELQDGEDTPLEGKDGEDLPEGRTFVMKDGDQLSSSQFLTESKADSEDGLEESSPQEQASQEHEQTDLDDQEFCPQPPESEDKARGIQSRRSLDNVPGQAASVLAAQFAARERLEKPRPEWWPQHGRS
jgi:hypothetical protein